MPFIGLHGIAALEECPLYLVSQAEDNALVNGILISASSRGHG